MATQHQSGRPTERSNLDNKQNKPGSGQGRQDQQGQQQGRDKEQRNR